jgi:hypothetical protein
VQDRSCWSIEPAQSAVLDGDGRRYTYMNETRNETNRSPGAYGEGSPGCVTFRLEGGESHHANMLSKSAWPGRPVGNVRDLGRLFLIVSVWILLR